MQSGDGERVRDAARAGLLEKARVHPLCIAGQERVRHARLVRRHIPVKRVEERGVETEKGIARSAADGKFICGSRIAHVRRVIRTGGGVAVDGQGAARNVRRKREDIGGTHRLRGKFRLHLPRHGFAVQRERDERDGRPAVQNGDGLHRPRDGILPLCRAGKETARLGMRKPRARTGGDRNDEQRRERAPPRAAEDENEKQCKEKRVRRDEPAERDAQI